MITVNAFPGAQVCDSLPYSLGGSAAAAQALRADGVDCLVGYLGAMNVARLGYLLDAGLGFMPVTYGTPPEKYNGAASVAQCKALGLPDGCSVWLDLEGLPTFHTPPTVVISAANAWATTVAGAGYMPCLYVGVPQPLTGDELWALKHVRYWHGQGEVRDRHNVFATPECGWTMVQKWPSVKRAGVLVDNNELREDLLGRVPAWAVAG